MIAVDRSEPTDIARYIEPVVDVTVLSLNEDRWADYRWSGEIVSHWPKHDGSYHVERKTWDDLADSVEQVEEQLREQLQHHPNSMLRLVVEGAIEPHPLGVMAYTRARGKDVLVGRVKGRPGSYASIMGKIAGWYEFLDVYPTVSYPATAALLVELYKRDQKPEDERHTFQKHFKPAIWAPNPMVVKLLGVAGKDTNIGVEKAEALIMRFGTVWAVLSARPEEIAQVRGISVDGAKLLLRRVGRLDV